MALLFVYGSLKEGFPNFHVNKGRRLPGDFKTVDPHPLWLYQGQLPCLLPSSGDGHRVMGQVFDVTPAELAEMDALERVGQPGGYSRIALQVVADAAGSAPFEAFAYAQDPALLQGTGPHVGPIAEYTQDHARHLRW